MEPITRNEIFLASAAGDYSGNLPDPVTREEMYLKEIADNTGGCGITIDTEPTEGSENAVSSGGVYTAIAEINATIGNINTVLEGVL